MINVKYKYKLQYNSLLGTIPDNDLFVKIKYRSNLSLWTETTYLYLLKDVFYDYELDEFFENYDNERVEKMIEHKLKNKIIDKRVGKSIDSEFKKFNKNSKSWKTISFEKK